MATKTLLILSSLLFSLTSTIAASSAPQISVWPKPVNVSWPNPKATTLSSSFQILTSCNHLYLRLAIRRYARFVLSERYDFIRPPLVNSSSSSMPQLKALHVSVADLRAPLQFGVDESYALWISSTGEANLTATTVWGAMHGLETFSQLVWGKKLMVPVDIYIGDKPIFGHRGFMLDTARNYYPVKDILRTIRALAANKMNVFHWHITDSQSFPMMLPSEPELAKKGAYGPKMVYTREDVRRIVEYGMRHAVRVVPEFDGPAHTGSWAKAYPDIVTCADMFWMPPGANSPERLAAEPGTGQLNPLNPKTYQVVQNVIRDAADIFPDTFYHAGADEVIPGCWKTDSTIQFFLKNGGSLGELLEIYIASTYPFILSHNRTVVYWEDVLLDAAVNVSSALLPPETTILQTWNNGPSNTKRIVSAGYRAIVSSADFYYLDCGHGSFIGNDSRYDKQVSDDPGMPFNFNGGSGGSWCGPYKTWQRVYDYDITHGLTEEEAKLVIGGEVALWSEQADETVLDGLVWPRASAMAEALWSGNRDAAGEKRYAEATDRLNEWRYRMVARGIAAAPIQPLWCLQNPGMCDLVQ